MPVYYFDTSALAKRYAEEVGTPWVLGITDPLAGNDIYVARVTGPEMISATYRKTRIVGGRREVSPDDASKAAADFRLDLNDQYLIVEITEGLADRSMELAQHHGLRGYDAVQLAAALELQAVRENMGLLPMTFVSADNNLNAVAVVSGISVDNPNAHP